MTCRLPNNQHIKRKVRSLAFVLLCFLPGFLQADVTQCPGLDAPPPPALNVDLHQLSSTLENLSDTKGRKIWKTTVNTQTELIKIFESVPAKTKLEQFFQLLHLLQKQIPADELPMVVKPPIITDILLTARVFTDPSFPKKITLVELLPGKSGQSPLYRVQFDGNEVHFPLNQGQGFASWDQGMCQIAKELIFYPGFSLRLRKAKYSNNLIVYNFDKVQIYGQFGTRKFVSIDLNYVDLERVEFINGTDQGKVKARVATREFKENKHSALFRFIGSMIPNTSKQRIDW